MAATQQRSSAQTDARPHAPNFPFIDQIFCSLKMAKQAVALFFQQEQATLGSAAAGNPEFLGSEATNEGEGKCRPSNSHT